MSEDRKFSILVVDDERSNIDALSYILKPTYKILVAKDGKTALEIARDRSPDLILLDIVMPGMDGFETLAKLKDSELTSAIPVIFITGRDNVEDEEKGLSLGAVDYITKPFNNSIVQARVRTHLQTVEHIRTIEWLGMMDALTNLPNRRSFDARLRAEWKRAIRDKKIISILMIDIDKFKDYNDKYGHTQGDVLLRSVAGILKQTLKRPSDFVARWGGDEFAALLPDTDWDGALNVAGQILVNVGCSVTPCPDGPKAGVATVSIGINTAVPVVGDSADNFVSGVDKALYEAKDAGRNTVRAY